jgi:folylpolyglutamate synthase/dihydropteroate synthase
MSDVRLGAPRSLFYAMRVILTSYQGLAGDHQQQNASLSIQIVQTFLQSQASIEPDTRLPTTYVEGLGNTKWPGRCQTVADPNHAKTTWFLDGAHTIESLECCMEWFASPGVGFAPVNSLCVACSQWLFQTLMNVIRI